ncbi:MAG: ATP-binding protein [Bacteroidota bacterium]
MTFIGIILFISMFSALFVGFRALLSSKGSLFMKALGVNLLMIGGLCFVEFEITRSVVPIEFLVPWYDSGVILVMFGFSFSALSLAHDTKSLPSWLFILLGSGAFVYLLLFGYGIWGLGLPLRQNIHQIDGIWRYQLLKTGFHPSLYFGGFVALYGVFNFSILWVLYYIRGRQDRKLANLILSFCVALGLVLFLSLLILVKPTDYKTFNNALSLSISLLPIILLYVGVRKYRIGIHHVPNFVINAINNPVFILDKQLKLRFYNKAVISYMGGVEEAAALKGMTIQAIASYLDLPKNLIYRHRQEVLELKAKKKFQEYYPLNILGRKCFFHVSITPIYWFGNTIFGYIVLATDITTTEQNRQTITTYAEQLQHTNLELLRFAQVASNDLKTPIRNINNYTRLIERKSTPLKDNTIQEYIDYIAKNAQMMYKLLEGLEQFSTIDQQQMHWVDLELVKNEVLHMFSDQIEATGATIQVNELPTVQSNFTLMSTLFKNLIENGLKYNDKHRPSISIQYIGRKDVHQIRFIDNGIGIETPYQDQVFDIFKRLHTHTQYSGTGMGLAICKKIVELHGGSITLKSKPGQGSQFMVQLPKIMEERFSSKVLERIHKVN